ncbi:recombinase family protein [Plastorhodobacter daqingensis]|uniref:Recombinase family protein n=1 Tax=Plastorhodobacter daqingensis TaxID=1387281 RepID=A0ABW2UP56_9RHOB
MLLRLPRFLGYTRVSTLRQERDGRGHEHQADAIRGFVADMGGELLAIYGDTGSGYGDDSLIRRADLQAALCRAREIDGAILVKDFSRLGRDLRLLQYLGEECPPIYCIEIGRQVTPEELHRGVVTAQTHAEAIQGATRASLDRARQSGKRLGNRTNLPVAQRMGAIANALRGNTKVMRIADHLERHPHCQSMTLRQLVEDLNAAGCWNLISERRNETKPWRMGSLRDPLRRAREMLHLWDEVAAEPFDTLRNDIDADAVDQMMLASEQQFEDGEGSIGESRFRDVAAGDSIIHVAHPFIHELFASDDLPVEDLPHDDSCHVYAKGYRLREPLPQVSGPVTEASGLCVNSGEWLAREPLPHAARKRLSNRTDNAARQEIKWPQPCSPATAGRATFAQYEASRPSTQGGGMARARPTARYGSPRRHSARTWGRLECPKPSGTGTSASVDRSSAWTGQPTGTRGQVGHSRTDLGLPLSRARDAVSVSARDAAHRSQASPSDRLHPMLGAAGIAAFEAMRAQGREMHKVAQAPDGLVITRPFLRGRQAGREWRKFGMARAGNWKQGEARAGNSKGRKGSSALQPQTKVGGWRPESGAVDGHKAHGGRCASAA